MMRLLCAIGWHRWRYLDNDHGGRPMRRACSFCGKRQCWDYDIAREHGAIRWINVQNNPAAHPTKDTK